LISLIVGQVVNLVKEKIIINQMVEFDMTDEKVTERAEGLRFDPVTNKIYQYPKLIESERRSATFECLYSEATDCKAD
jgi:hypothetical protein